MTGTYKIEMMVRERLAHLPLRPVLCKICRQEILLIAGSNGRRVAVDLELKAHKCKKGKS